MQKINDGKNNYLENLSFFFTLFWISFNQSGGVAVEARHRATGPRVPGTGAAARQPAVLAPKGLWRRGARADVEAATCRDQEAVTTEHVQVCLNVNYVSYTLVLKSNSAQNKRF